MSLNLLYILCGAIIAGLLLIVLGAKGRRINDHPICRGCKFDLDGVYPESVTCPECGSGLKRDNAVQNGARKRLWLVVVFGALLTATPLVPLGAVAVAALTGRDLDKLKPVGLLLWEARHADAIRTGKIASELLSREQAKLLSADQNKTVIDAALAIQADPTAAWDPGWGDCIEQAKLDGTLTKEQEESFIKHALNLKVEGRSRVRAGDTIPLVVSVGEKRVGTTTSMMATLAVASAKCGATQLENPPEKPGPVFIDPFGFGRASAQPGPGGKQLGTLSITGPRAPAAAFSFGANSNQYGLSYDLPKDLTPGPTTLTLDIDASTASASRGGLTMFSLNGKVQPAPGGHTDRITLTLPIEVVSADKTAIAATKPSEELTQKLADQLRPKELAYRSDVFSNPFENQGSASGGAPADVSFDTKGLPAPIAFDVFCRVDGAEYRMGTLTSGKLPPSAEDGMGALRSSFTSSFSMTINGKVVSSSSSSQPPAGSSTVSSRLPIPKGTTVDIILRPSESTASQTIDLTTYYGGEIVFKDVAVNKTEFEMLPTPTNPFRTRQPSRARGR